MVIRNESNEWNDWQATALQETNSVENVYKWDCEYVSSKSFVLKKIE